MKLVTRWKMTMIGVVLTVIMSLPPQVSSAAFTEPVLIGCDALRKDNITAFIPQINGLQDKNIEAKLNGVIRDDVERGINQFQLDWANMQQEIKLPEDIKKGAHFWSTYAVKYNKGNVLSLTTLEYVYTGGAHGSSGMHSYAFNVSNGRVYTLTDIFLPGTNFGERLEGLIKADIAANNKTYYHFEGLNDNQAFYLTEEGLVIYFQPYEIASWADGFIRFIIPYNKISDIINPDLPLY